MINIEYKCEYPGYLIKNTIRLYLWKIITPDLREIITLEALT